MELVSVIKGDVKNAVAVKPTVTVSGSCYTIQPGDSWWSIAAKHGLSMYALASRNGKTIYTVIHPGDKHQSSPRFFGDVFCVKKTLGESQESFISHHRSLLSYNSRQPHVFVLS